MSIATAAKDVAVDIIDGAIRYISDERKSRRNEPHYWAAWHQVHYRSLPKWRRLARWWHLSRSRRYRSHVIAGRRTR